MSPLSSNGPKVVTWPQCRQVIINVKIETDQCKCIDKITQFSCIKTLMFTWTRSVMRQYDMIWWYDMILYDMIWYDNAICHGIWYEIWYEIWCDMRSYDVAYEWYGMVWCYIHCWEKGKLAVIPLISYHFYTQCVLRLVCCVSVCVCLVVVGWVGVGCLRRCMVTLGPLIFSSATTRGMSE